MTTREQREAKDADTGQKLSHSKTRVVSGGRATEKPFQGEYQSHQAELWKELISHPGFSCNLRSPLLTSHLTQPAPFREQCPRLAMALFFTSHAPRTYPDNLDIPLRSLRHKLEKQRGRLCAPVLIAAIALHPQASFAARTDSPSGECASPSAQWESICTNPMHVPLTL